MSGRRGERLFETEPLLKDLRISEINVGISVEICDFATGYRRNGRSCKAASEYLEILRANDAI